MPKGFFVTGTDTGVGKTIITAALILALRRLGFKTGGMKPIETGCLQEGKTLIPSDGMFIKTITRMEESFDYTSPCRFLNPLAPLAAAEREKIPIDLEKIRKAYTALSEHYDALIIEGIGGLLVPITGDYFVSNLAREFGFPIIVVSKPGLGTINHTMLTVNYAVKEGLTVAGIIINYNHPPEGTLAEKTNPDIIKKISPVPLIGIFPHLENLERSTIEKAAVEKLDIELIRTCLAEKK
jgi:dethiobiotin synthetase